MALVLSARINHVCHWCGEGIKQGLPYERIPIRFDNWQVRSFAMHLECAEVHKRRDRAGINSDELWTPGDDYEERPKP